MKNRLRSFTSISFRVLVTLILVAFVLSRVELKQVLNDFGSSTWWGPTGAGLLLLLNIGLQWLRWHTLVRSGGLALSPVHSFRILLAGYPLGFLTPGRIGELGRGLMVPGKHDSVSVAGLTVLERAFSLLGGVGLASLAMILSGYGNLWKWTLILMTYFSVLYAALHPHLLARWIGSLAPRLPDNLRKFSSDWVDRFVEGWNIAGRRTALAVFLLSIMQSATVVAQLTLCYLAAGSVTVVLKVVGAWAVVLGAKYFLPITLGDVGVREGLAVLIFTDRNLPVPAAIVAALMIYVFNVLLPALAGGLILLGTRNKSEESGT